MTREETREEIAVYIYKCFSTWKENCFYDRSNVNKQGWLQYADDMLASLHSQGVVIKAERELPTFYTSKMPTCEKGLECSFVEPLIKED